MARRLRAVLSGAWRGGETAERNGAAAGPLWRAPEANTLAEEEGAEKVLEGAEKALEELSLASMGFSSSSAVSQGLLIVGALKATH